MTDKVIVKNRLYYQNNNINQGNNMNLSWVKKAGQGLLTTALASTLATSLSVQANDTPGKGVTVIPVKSSIAEVTFQTLLISRALTDLGFKIGRAHV